MAPASCTFVSLWGHALSCSVLGRWPHARRPTAAPDTCTRLERQHMLHQPQHQRLLALLLLQQEPAARHRACARVCRCPRVAWLMRAGESVRGRAGEEQAAPRGSSGHTLAQHTTHSRTQMASAGLPTTHSGKHGAVLQEVSAGAKPSEVRCCSRVDEDRTPAAPGPPGALALLSSRSVSSRALNTPCGTPVRAGRRGRHRWGAGIEDLVQRQPRHPVRGERSAGPIVPPRAGRGPTQAAGASLLLLRAAVPVHPGLRRDGLLPRGALVHQQR